MEDLTLGRVVVGVDDSPAGRSALRCAVAQARQRGAVLHAVRAFAVPPTWRRPTAQTWWQHAVGHAECYVRRVFASAIGTPPAAALLVDDPIAGRPEWC